jgi:nicotinate-nucleotide adenylyltransferase
MRIGVYGGGFNPPHIAHLLLAQEAWAQLDLDKVLLVPYGQPPHRTLMGASAQARWCMCATLALRHPWLEASRLEIDRPAPSYMVDTLRALAGDDLFLLVGADQAERLHEWHQADEIVRLAEIAAVERIGSYIGDHRLRAHVRWLAMSRVDVRSTDVRERIAAGRPWRALVPSEIANFIEREGLYR